MTTIVDAPARADGLQLLGTMVGSGYRTPPALVRRSDGQVLQLTPLLYLVLSAADGRRSHAEIAEVVGRDLPQGVAGLDGVGPGGTRGVRCRPGLLLCRRRGRGRGEGRADGRRGGWWCAGSWWLLC